MFQSIKYLNCKYNYRAKLYYYNYEITDSEFISTSGFAHESLVEHVVPAAVVIKTYEGRNYNHKEIISNLFLLNMFLVKKFRHKDLNETLESQHKYLTKENYPETNFHEKYYKDLMQYTNKMITLI